MSHNRYKTKYIVEEQGISSSYDVEKTLYASYNNSCDIVTFYDNDFDILFYAQDTVKNNRKNVINFYLSI